MSDTIRSLKNKISSDLALSVPGISPAHFKAMIDFVAAAVKVGENVHDAILDAVIRFKDRNPELKFNEDDLISKLNEHISSVLPERDIDHKPVLENESNRNLADAIIGKIKSDPQYKESVMNRLMEHPSLTAGTKKAISDYIEYYTKHEDTIIHDVKNPHFLDDYKLKTSEETAQFVSGATIADVFGKVPEGNQDYAVMKQADMLADGERMIELAREHFGGDVMQWAPRLLDTIKEMRDNNTPKKAVILATMQGRLREEMLRHPEREGQIQKVLNSTEEYWQTFIRKSALDLVAARLLRVYRDKNMSDFYADQILSDQQRSQRKVLQDALQTTEIPDQVAQDGPLRDHATVIEELKAENERLKKELEQKPSKKGNAEQREEWAKKSKDLAKDSEVGSLLENIKEQLKKIKC